MKMKKSFKRPLAFVLAFALLATAIGIGAYLTDSDVKKDVYTVGNVQAEIVSNGDMELDNVGALLPGTVHAYERAATNTGINDAYVFMSLTIPYEMVGVSDEDGTQIGERVRQLFIPGYADGFIGSEWKLVDVGYIGQYEIEDNGQYCGEHDQYSAVVGDTITYVYGFIGDNADGSLKALASGETTSNLVETMELTNLYNASKITGEVSTKLYAIQSANVNGGLTDVNGVWAVINKAITGAENTAASTLTYNITNTKSGEVVGYAPLKLVDENGNVVATSVANENGNGQFQNVPAGNYAIETAVGDLSVQGGATGYAMRRVAANVTLAGEDQTIDLALTTPGTTLIKGTEFNALIPESVTSIEFIANGKAGADAFDVSEAKDGTVMAWVEGTTMYVASMNSDVIYANPDSSFMFRGKTNLTSINAANLDCSGAYNVQLMFYGCTGLSNVDIDAFDFDNFTTGASMFTNCGWLTEIVLPETLTSIDKYMFNNCQNLTSVVLPDGLTHIGYGAFQNCKSLTTITIPASVTVIEDSAFRGSGLTNIYFEGDQSQISFGNNWNYNTPMNPIAHKCTSICPTCKGCLDVDCKESACSAKCKCGVVTTGTVAFSITDNLTEEQTFGSTFASYNVSLGTLKDNNFYTIYSVNVEPGKTVLLTDVTPGTYDILVDPILSDGSYWMYMDQNLVDVKSITVKAGTQSCNINLGEVVVQNGYANLSVTDYNTWGQTVSAYEFVIDGKTYTVNPGKTSRVTLPEGTYKDVVVYAVFADGSKSTSIQDNNTFVITANKTVTFKVALGEIPNFDWTIGVNDLLTWDGKTVDHYDILIDNKDVVTVSPVESSTISKKETISVKAGSHSVSVTVYFTDGTSVSAKSYQSTSSFNVSKALTSTIILGYKVNVAVVDNYAWGTAPTSYKVSFGGKNLTVQSGKNGSTQVAPGTYDVVVYAVMADKSQVELVADTATLVVDKSGATYTITVNGPVGAGNEPEVPETPETSGVTFAIVDNIDRGQSVNEYQVIINNKEYNAFATGETKVTNAIEIPNGTYTYYVCVMLKDGSMQIANDGFELIISGEGEHTIVLQN